MSGRAEAAYAAYANAVGWKSFQGETLLNFNELPEAIQLAWDAACEGALRHWLENDFKDAANNDELVEKHAVSMLKVGIARGHNVVEYTRRALASFVIDCVAPEVLEDARKQLRAQREQGEQR